MSHKGKFALLALGLVVLAGCRDSVADSLPPQEDVALKLREAIVASQGDVESDAEAEVQERTGWGTIKGRFVVVGPTPTLAPLRADKDTEVCGTSAPDDSIKVGADGSLANLTIYAVGLKGDNVHESAASPVDDSVLFDQEKCIFLTRVTLMQTGQKLRVKNSDTVSHNTLIKTKRSPETNITINAKDEKLLNIPAAEKTPVPVACSVHPWMLAYLFPHENGYAAVTGDDGTFEIANLPAGIDLKILVWHERLKKFNKIDVNGEEQTWKRGVVKLDKPLEPDEVRELEIKIPAGLLGG